MPSRLSFEAIECDHSVASQILPNRPRSNAFPLN
jgi:hypothetical protein